MKCDKEVDMGRVVLFHIGLGSPVRVNFQGGERPRTRSIDLVELRKGIPRVRT